MRPKRLEKLERREGAGLKSELVFGPHTALKNPLKMLMYTLYTALFSGFSALSANQILRPDLSPDTLDSVSGQNIRFFGDVMGAWCAVYSFRAGRGEGSRWLSRSSAMCPGPAAGIFNRRNYQSSYNTATRVYQSPLALIRLSCIL